MSNQDCVTDLEEKTYKTAVGKCNSSNLIMQNADTAQRDMWEKLHKNLMAESQVTEGSLQNFSIKM